MNTSIRIIAEHYNVDTEEVLESTCIREDNGPNFKQGHFVKSMT